MDKNTIKKAILDHWIEPEVKNDAGGLAVGTYVAVVDGAQEALQEHDALASAVGLSVMEAIEVIRGRLVFVDHHELRETESGKRISAQATIVGIVGAILRPTLAPALRDLLLLAGPRAVGYILAGIVEDLTLGCSSAWRAAPHQSIEGSAGLRALHSQLGDVEFDEVTLIGTHMAFAVTVERLLASVFLGSADETKEATFRTEWMPVLTRSAWTEDNLNEQMRDLALRVHRANLAEYKAREGGGA